ncbi:MAG TPA: hypothetical protein VFT66_18530 [Roseiflexaceae bacterium]|nr:hypothetical protein [Roseiflexaceae bacterium]
MASRSIVHGSLPVPQTAALRVRGLALPLVIGLCAALLCTAWNMLAGRMAGDFTWPLRGAQVLLQGKDPYAASLAPLPYLVQDPLYYPLPLVVCFIPFAWLPDAMVGGLVFGIITAVMVWALQRAQKPLWWFLTSPMFAMALLSTNWSPLILACYLVPALLPFSLFKPQFLLPSLVVYPPKELLRVWRGWMVIAVLTVASFMIFPAWLQGWLHAVAHAHHDPPSLLMPVGPLLLIALLRRKRQEARFFLVYTLTPQLVLWYDQLPLLLVARTRRDVLLMNGMGWLVGLAGWLVFGYYFLASPLIIPFLGTFVPALIVILCAPHQVEARAAVMQDAPAAPL